LLTDIMSPALASNYQTAYSLRCNHFNCEKTGKWCMCDF